MKTERESGTSISGRFIGEFESAVA